MLKTHAPFTTILALLAVGCADPILATSAEIRVVHLSPDAPAIDVFVDEELALEGLTFTEGSDALPVAAGDRSLQVVRSGSPATAELVSIDDALVEVGRSYTAFAFGPRTDLQAAVIEDSARGLPTGLVRVRVIHAAGGVGTVDVYGLSGASALDPIAENLRYGNAAEPVDLPVDAFVVGVDVDDDGEPDLRFPIPALPAGANVNVFATADEVGAVFLLAQLPTAVVRIDPVRQELRVVHLSPDAPAVRPLIDGTAPSMFDAITFGSSTDYTTVSNPMAELDVTTDGTLATSVLNVPLNLEAATSFTAVAFGRVANIDGLLLADDRTVPESVIRVRAIHGAPDVGAVDLYDQLGAGPQNRIVEGLTFGNAAEPLTLSPGAHTLGVDVDGDAVPNLYFELPSLEGGVSANLFVTQDASGTVFVLAQLDGRTTARIDASQSEVRVLHLSRDAPNVDVYAGSDRVVDNLAFTNQSTRLTVPSGQLAVAVTAAGAPLGTAVISANVALSSGRNYTIVAYGDVANIDAAVLEDDATNITPGSIRVPVTHVAPGVTRGDVYELLGGGTMFGAQLVDDFGFGETQPSVDLPAGMYTVGFDAESDGDIQAVFDLPLLTPGTFARAFVYQELDGTVGVLVQLSSTTTRVLAR